MQREIKPVFITLQPIVRGKHFKLLVRCKFKILVVRLPLITESTESTYTALPMDTTHTDKLIYIASFTPLSFVISYEHHM